MSRITSFREPGRRYAALRMNGFLCTLIGVILLIGGGGLLTFSVYTLATGGTATPPMETPPFPGARSASIPSPLVGGISLLWSIGILFSGLQLIVMGGFLKLMIHLEENTRASAQVLDSLRSRLEASPAGDEVRFSS